MSLYARAAVLLVVIVVIAGLAWKAYYTIDKGGYDRAMAEWDKATMLANETARETERLNQKSKEIAIENRTREILANVAAAERTRIAADGLRDSSKRSLQSARDTPAACVVSADTHAELLGKCEAEYRSLAEKADGHAADTKALIHAWPR